MVVWVLVMWFGIGDQQTSFSVPGIVSQEECRRLGAQMKPHYREGSADVQCYPYRVPAAKMP